MKKQAIFIGSSVCVGSGATDNRGWAAITAERMREDGWSTSNCAIGGQTTADILLRLERDVIDHQPDLCFVGLGLANEGLPGAEGVQCEIIRGIFESNLRKIVSALTRSGIRPVLGGVYPNNRYTPEQYATLQDCRAEMSRWFVPVLDWLPRIDDGYGHFRPGYSFDAGHPNDAGYAAMAKAVDAELWRGEML